MKFFVAMIAKNHSNQIDIMNLSITLLSGLLLLGTASFSAAATDTAKPVGQLGTIVMTASQLNDLIDSADPEVRQQLKNDPAALKQIIRTELIRLIVLDEANGKQWDKRPAVQRQLQRSREELLVSSYLNDLSRPPAGYPSEQEVSQAYESSKDSFKRPRRFHLAQIYIGDTAASDKQVAERSAKELASKAKSEDFAQLATKHSQHALSAARGGDMGWIDEDQLIPEMKDQVVKLTPGTVSQPIRSQTGWHVVKLLESKPAGIAPLSEVRETIIAGLRLARARQLEQEYLVKLLENRKFNIDETALQEAIK